MGNCQFIHPSSIRVWRGFRNQQYQNDWAGFVARLSEIFIPLTCQAMMPIGLKSYIPTLLKSDNDQLPDEIALVGYADQNTYYSASRDTVIGRGYSLLHYEVFNFDHDQRIPSSQSTFPLAYSKEKFEISQPYYFSGKPIDWSVLEINVFVISLDTLEKKNASAVIMALADKLQYAVFHNLITESILVQDLDCLILWVGLEETQCIPDDISECLAVYNKVIHSISGRATVPYMWTESEVGIAIKDNQTLNLTLNTSDIGAFYYD